MREIQREEEIGVTLPKSGEYASLKKGDQVHFGWSGDLGTCFRVGE